MTLIYLAIEKQCNEKLNLLPIYRLIQLISICAD
ncbi:MAG: hypothetical protein ACI892_001777, partial [Marinobacter maritimus]